MYIHIYTHTYKAELWLRQSKQIPIAYEAEGAYKSNVRKMNLNGN